jgi:sulfur-oxidizing protein SoxY
MEMSNIENIVWSRRTTLRSLLLAGTAVALPSLLGVPAHAADGSAWPEDAFAQKNESDALRTLYGKQATTSDKISIDVPEIAENGAVVPVSVQASLPDVTSIAILIPNNPFTLAASYDLPEGALPNVSCRLKMGQTSDVVVVVESAGNLYSARKQVKVTLGGCGG